MRRLSECLLGMCGERGLSSSLLEQICPKASLPRCAALPRATCGAIIQHVQSGVLVLSVALSLQGLGMVPQTRLGVDVNPTACYMHVVINHCSSLLPSPRHMHACSPVDTG
eukprot:363200-Chlamydomonas_euryale.AAC.8